MRYRTPSAVSRIALSATMCMLALVLFACDDAVQPIDTLERVYTFEESAESWTGAFADYPTTKSEEELELEFEHRALPAGLDESGMGLFFAGLNQSDDLFMFTKRQLTDLEPNTTYDVNFFLEIASNAPSDCVGIGGPPGEAVRVKVGAVNVEPEPVVTDGNYRLNVDKDVNDGDAADHGSVAEIGNIANGLEECTGEVPYRMIALSTQNDLTVTTDDQGSLWLFVGTDSGFEGKTTLFYDTIEVLLDPS